MSTKKIQIADVFIHGFFIFISILFTVPVLTVVAISLSNENDIMEYGYRIIPKVIDFTAYNYVFSNPGQILNAYKVSVFISLAGATVSVFILLAVAYVLSRRIFRYRNVIAFFIFFTMLFNGGLIPKYILVTQYLHLQDTLAVLILNDLVIVWYIFILRAFVQEIPEEIIESVMIDGASEFRIFFSIIVPLSKPAIATIGLFILLAYWNDWMTSLIYISDTKLYPLQYLLQRILQDLQIILDNMDNIPASMLSAENTPAETTRMALAIISAGPMLFIMPFFQKYFVRGLTIGSVKG